MSKSKRGSISNSSVVIEIAPNSPKITNLRKIRCTDSRDIIRHRHILVNGPDLFWRNSFGRLIHRACDSSLSIYEVEALLQRVTRTAPGGDCVPYWVFRLCSVELAEIITHIYNTSLRTGCLPSQWLTAIITPIPKIPTPKTLADFRPISFSPILSRISESIIVRRWIIPAINQNSVADQFAFRPSGSTTCALVYLMHHVTNMLENNTYVRCLMIDFSKAFDQSCSQVP